MIDKTTSLVRQLVEALEANQWGFNFKRCSLCAGWNMSPYGETDLKHTAECPVAIAISEGKRWLSNGDAV